MPTKPKRKPPAKPKAAPRNRVAEARAAGKRMIAMELPADFDDLINAVRDHFIKRDNGRPCTRVYALEQMGREGAKVILRK